MSTQKFPLEVVKKIRHYIQETLSLEEAERQSQTWSNLDDNDELPEPESLDDLSGIFAFGGLSAEEVSAPKLQGHWAVSTVNPAASLLKLPGLRLNPTFRLVSYVYREDSEGAGLIFAVPEPFSATSYLDQALKYSGNLSQPPKPEAALNQCMEAIEGDRSAVSFIVASILQREFRAFGALGKRRSWEFHRFLDALPAQASCQWRVDPAPKDLSVKVKVLPNGQAAVEFFTYRAGNPTVLYRHLDQYPAKGYQATISDKPIAIVSR